MPPNIEILPDPHPLPPFGAPGWKASIDAVKGFNPLTESIKVIYEAEDRRVVSVGGGAAIRYAYNDPANIVATAAFVLDKTTVPTPRIYTSFFDAGSDRHCILMEMAPGESAETFLDSERTDDDGAEGRIAGRAAPYLKQLRANTSTLLGPIGKGPYLSNRLASGGLIFFKPEATERDFLHQVILNCDIALDSPRARAIVAVHASYLEDIGDPTPPFVLSHCDFCPPNVMVDSQTGDVLSVIDWERSGFFPAWWEPILCMISIPMRWYWKLEILEALGTRKEWQAMARLLWPYRILDDFLSEGANEILGSVAQEFQIDVSCLWKRDD